MPSAVGQFRGRHGHCVRSSHRASLAMNQMVNHLVDIDKYLDENVGVVETRRMPAAARPPLGPLLITCARLLDEVAQAQVNREAGDRIARPALMRLVPFLDRNGIRPSELARRADITKQAVGQTLKACESLGLVEFAADRADGRAQLVRLTSDGEA